MFSRLLQKKFSQKLAPHEHDTKVLLPWYNIITFCTKIEFEEAKMN